MPLTARKKILDFGCGDGYRSIYLGRKADYWGVDISDENIKKARNKYRDKSFVLIAENSLPFENVFFDEIYLFDVLEHLNNPHASFKEVLRCLKKNGKLIVEIPYYKSEEFLKKIHPAYLIEIGHKNIFSDEAIVRLIKEFNLILLKKTKKRGIENIYLALMFFWGNRIVSETGDFERGSLFWRRVMGMFSEDFFSTKLFLELRFFWFLFPLWVLTYPVGWLLSHVFPKAIRYEFRK
ncbi:hypothetical protein A2276_05500 [candidate division WOR-1 bacterium RIFOXYA12_FULL_43_27]|uniref:Methyltransferase type 11 domain-containing protein n=1 Tax=candidate division WOR-1 bacterium RIFOXYC2_FULL_46_14 TaxID=1802587 RepID=A0A1F4U3Q2_UNCSA|nr:MAG: hypothetical protein A2276_05500 [candidate division WOR-1 bacterium RIFOXYA12_FULL_43_27]OGC20121.1 MAG: hypothetical protein A2292_03505 [candidate division WOR-1 bacterium RIFOXYB2_FULL_46_45]OGC32142.1 MAG: hypothetical protein A2232_07945 [candidate division WOR-1 bacterium RIFOXYA2_FULL_46_56]OGC39542.1 MAG: hypothetical protein A2438_08310 [candidate division WOR-1 bacterium RIFOXYC2_FULL_46_14]